MVNVEYKSLFPSLRARGLWSSLEGMIVLLPRVSESYMVYFEDFVHNFIHNNLYYIVWHMLTLFFLFRVVQPLGVLICMLGFISISAHLLHSPVPSNPSSDRRAGVAWPYQCDGWDG